MLSGMKIRTNVRSGSSGFNRNAKKLGVKRARGVVVRSGVRAGWNQLV